MFSKIGELGLEFLGENKERFCLGLRGEDEFVVEAIIGRGEDKKVLMLLEKKEKYVEHWKITRTFDFSMEGPLFDVQD